MQTHVTILELGRGSVGQVELACPLGSDAPLVAIKRLRPHLRGESELRRMMLDEARLAGTLRHPNVVAVLDAGEDADGPFLVMEYVEGVSLARILSDTFQREELLPILFALHTCEALARGLDAAHGLRDGLGRALDVVHRDVSPPNVLAGFDGIVQLTDFGVARAVDRFARTRTGVVKGRGGYLSPEQIRFEAVDARSDLFALGVVLFEMLAGRRLYASTPDDNGARRILADPPPDIGDLRPETPPELVELTFELLAKDREHRPESARSVAERLAAVRADLEHEDGPLDMAAFLEALYGTFRRARRAAVERRLAELGPVYSKQ